jgi:hypothetical protein
MSGASSSSLGQLAQQAFPILHHLAPELDASRLRIASEPCPYPDCNRTFGGSSRKGNMSRHMQTKHGISGRVAREFPCASIACEKTFKRRDARLNHERKQHPELGRMSAAPRRLWAYNPPSGSSKTVKCCAWEIILVASWNGVEVNQDRYGSEIRAEKSSAIVLRKGGRSSEISTTLVLYSRKCFCLHHQIAGKGQCNCHF